MQLFEHPEYVQNKRLFQKWHDLYEGDHEILRRADYLFYHSLERTKGGNDNEQLRINQMRKDREQRTRYLNVPEIVMSLWLSMLFRRHYELDESAKALLEEYEQDIDGKGTSLFTFIKRDVMETRLLYGQVFVLADAYPGEATNLSEEQEIGMRPFLEVISPLALKDWDIEARDPKRAGKFNFLRHEFKATLPRMSPTDKPETKLFSNSLQLKDGIYVVQQHSVSLDANGNYTDRNASDGSANWTEEGDPIVTALEEIPVAYIKDESWLKDVCEETLRHFNLRSMKDSIEFAQGFQKIFITGIDFSNPQAVKALSEFTISGLPENSAVLTVEPVSTADLRASVSEALENAFKVGLNQLRQIPQDSRAVQGADTLQEDKDNTIALLDSTISEVETLLNESIRTFARFKGIEDFDGKISLNQELTEKSIDQLVQLWQGFSDLYSGNDVVTKEMAKKVVRKLDFDEEATEKAIEAIDKQQTERNRIAESPIRQGLLGALNGRQAASRTSEEQGERPREILS